MAPKIIGKCPDCGKDITWLMDFRGFSITKHPYGPTERDYWQFKATKKVEDAIDEILLQTFEDYGFFLTERSLVCDTGQSTIGVFPPSEANAIKMLKRSINLYQRDRDRIIRTAESILNKKWWNDAKRNQPTMS